MVKKTKIIISITLCILGIVLFLLINSFMVTNLSELDGEGELQNSYVSPNREHRADVYLIDKGGATVAEQIRVSVTSLQTDQFKDNTIYWEYPSNEAASIEWINDHEIIIDGKQILITDSNTYYNWKDNE